MPGYPNYFTSNYPTPGYPNLMMQQNNQNGIIWVQGEAGAKSYIVAPNTTVTLWDSENPVIYLKSADASGMPNIKTLDYVVRDHTSVTQNLAPNSDYIKRDDLFSIESRLDALEQKFDGLNKSSSVRKKEVKDE